MIWLLMIGMLSVMTIVLLVLIVYRKRLAKYIVSSQQEGMVHWSRSPTIHVTEDNYQDQIQELRGMILKMASSIDTDKKVASSEDQEVVVHQEDLDNISNKSLISLH